MAEKTLAQPESVDEPRLLKSGTLVPVKGVAAFSLVDPVLESSFSCASYSQGNRYFFN